MTEPTIWGVHMGRHHGHAPIAEGFVSIGWSGLGDLEKLSRDREAFKEHLLRHYGQSGALKEGAVPVYAGLLYRFVYEMKEGDLVVYPSKEDRTVNIGRLGAYRFNPNSSDNMNADNYETAHQRKVDWLAHVPRAAFPQAALNEIGSALTLFKVANNPQPFLSALAGDDILSDEDNDDAVTEAASEEVKERAEDFIIKQLKERISDERFEHFTAHLLRCMGYHARVTQKSADGGVDIIAHKDELGFEPPVIKVQCKQILNSIGRPDVQRLMGVVEPGEFGLFVTLGGYTREALDAERSRPSLRLIDGPALCKLIFAHYERFDPQWQAVIPLEQQYIPRPQKPK